MARKMPLCHFLLVYDYDRQELVEQREFHDAEEASLAYADTERRYRDGNLPVGSETVEIVLVGADSIETIMRTHGHYFDREAVSPYLTGV